jgi:hypothetical protein
MEALQTSSEPKALAHVVKHFAFTRCGELNVFGIVDSQVAVLERELFSQRRFTQSGKEETANYNGSLRLCMIRGSNRRRVLRQFEILKNTPQAFANFSPGFERSENPGDII